MPTSEEMVVAGWSPIFHYFLRNLGIAPTPNLKKQVDECVIQARRAQRRSPLSKPFFRIFKSSFTM